MSSKKKKEDKDKSVGVTVTPDTPEIKDIIPNRVSEALWEQWTQWDELSESVADIMSTIIERSWEDIDYNFKARQLVPLTVDWAMREMMEVVEWNFMRRDRGDSCSVVREAWREEREPVSCQLDAWARGKVPIRGKPITLDDRASPPPVMQSSLSSSRPHDSPTHPPTEESESASAHATSQLSEANIVPGPPTLPRAREATRGDKVASHQSKRGNTSPHKHQLEIRTISESTSFPEPPPDTTLHLLLTQSTDQYLRTHRITAVPSKRLPANKVTPKVNIMQPAATRVLETAKLRHSNTFASKHDPISFSPVPEPLIEKIDPAPGVSVVQGDVIKRGPRALWTVPNTTQGLSLKTVLPLQPIAPSSVLGENSVRTNLKNDVMT